LTKSSTVNAALANPAATAGVVLRVLTGGRDSSDLQRYIRNNPLFSEDFIGGRDFLFRVPGNPQATRPAS